MNSSHAEPGPYALHKAALQPLIQPGRFSDALNIIQAEDEDRFLTFLIVQGLAPLWANLLHEHMPDAFSEHFRKTLHHERLNATGAYLIQHNGLKTVTKVLDEAGIEHVVYKGADTRDRYYRIPALRPCVDIDVLVREGDRDQALEAFRAAGFSLKAKRENVSHEVSLLKGKLSIDLHWHIMRPGRIRNGFTDRLIVQRQQFELHWGMKDEANLFVMLVHPVFTKYSTTAMASLVRINDLLLVLARNPGEEDIYELLDSAGLKTAGWITLRWLEILAGKHPGTPLQYRLAPGKIRRTYLEQWLQRNLATKLVTTPALVQVGFSLAAHDRATDALRAIKFKQQARGRAEDELATIEGVFLG